MNIDLDLVGVKGTSQNRQRGKAFLRYRSGDVVGWDGEGPEQVVPRPEFVQPRIIKQFSDLLDVSIATTSASVTSTIDVSSPFGCPALKLVITFSAGGRVEVTPPALNIPSFNGHLGYTVWFDDTTKFGTASVFVGTSGYALYQQSNRPTFSAGNLVAGPAAIYAGPCRQTNVTDGGFVFGTSTLIDHKLRISAPNPVVGTCTVWVKDCFIARPQRPIVVFSFDDGFDTWTSYVAPALAQYGLRATFGVNSNQIDSATGISSTNLRALIAAGHQITSHNVQNYKLQTLYGAGNGKSNGTSTSQTATEYATDYHTGRKALEALGADPQDFMYHPWVQGGVDHVGVESLSNAGVEIARGTDPYETQIYGMFLGNNAMNLRAVELASSRTLAQAKTQVDLAVTHGGLCWFMGHTLSTTSTDAVTWTVADFQALVAYVASLDVDVLTARQLRDRLNAFGLLNSRKALVNSNAMPVRMIGRLIGANMNSTADQSITLMAGTWKIEGIYVTTPSTSLTTAAGGFYTATSKGGTEIVAAAQAYTTLTASTSVLGCTMAATPTVSNNTIYLSLTTGQGATATADVFVYGRPA